MTAAAALHRMQQLMSPPAVPSISTELLTTADGELNRELNAFLFDPPSDPDLLKGRRTTAVWNIQIDLENAGATVLDEPCVIDGNLITARLPYDLPRLIGAMVERLPAATR
jgi:putative intracellular protease/amidase